LFDGLFEASDEDVYHEHEVVLVSFAARKAGAELLVQEIPHLSVHKGGAGDFFDSFEVDDLDLIFKCFKRFDDLGGDVDYAHVRNGSDRKTHAAKALAKYHGAAYELLVHVVVKLLAETNEPREEHGLLVEKGAEALAVLFVGPTANAVHRRH